MYSPQRLHPISYVLSIIEAVKSNFLFVIIFVLFQLDSFDFTDWTNYKWPSFIALSFTLVFINRTIEIYRTRYWIEGDYFIVKSGLFNLEQKELNIRRIQSMDTVQPIVHQLVGGVKLTIKTPSDGIDLNMVTKRQSQWIQEEIEKAKSRIESEDGRQMQSEHSSIATDEHYEAPPIIKTNAPTEMIYQLSTQNLLLMAMTSGAVFVTLATVGPIVTAFEDIIPWEGVFGQVESWIKNLVALVITLVIGILVIAYIIGVIITMVRYYRFTLTRSGDFLKIRYGLLKVTNLSLPIAKLQAVQEKKSFFRHLFGFTSYHFIITSDMEVDIEDDFASGEIMVLPFIKQREGTKILASLLPIYSFQPVETGLPWQGFHRRFWIPSVILIGIGALIHYYWWVWIWIPIAVIILYLIIHSVIATRMSGSGLTDEEVSIRKVTWFGFKTTTFKKDKILGFQQTAHPLMQQKQLVHFDFTIASGSVSKDFGLRFEHQSKVTRNKQWYLGGEDINGKDE
ncbi:PH domain-containing protein [Staphylococcus pseudintermedius]